MDLENIIDDIVLLNFVVGNDFLPHLPGYNVKFAGVDMILELYKNSINSLGGYLTAKCSINLKQLEKMFLFMSYNESQVISKVAERVKISCGTISSRKNQTLQAID